MDYEEIKGVKTRMKNKYGMNLEDIDILLVSQNYQCPICRNRLIEGERVIDHNHETGKVRGILCRSCNMALGCLKDSMESCENASRYLYINMERPSPLVREKERRRLWREKVRLNRKRKEERHKKFINRKKENARNRYQRNKLKREARSRDRLAKG